MLCTFYQVEVLVIKLEMFEKQSGFEEVVIKDIWAGKRQCWHCKQLCDHHLYRKTDRGYLFYVMIYDVTKERYLFCDGCKVKYTIDKKEYDKISKHQLTRLNEGAFPLYIMKSDYSPKKIDLRGKIFGFLLALIFFASLFCFSVDLTLNNEFSAALVFCWIIMTSIPLILLIITFKNMVNAVRNYKLYRKAVSK